MLIHGDCLEKMKELDDNSIDSIVTDPPYGLKFMGKNWDYGIPGIPFWQEALRVAKPGAHLLAFGGTRTYHRLACAIEDAGWEIRDTVMWVYGCLSEDTEIMTDKGWKKYNEIDGLPVMCFNPQNHEFTFEIPYRRYLYDNQHTAYRIQSDSTDQIVSRNHRVLIEREGRMVFETAEALTQESEICVPILESVVEQSRTQTIRRTRATITPIEYHGKVWCVSVSTGAFVACRNGKIFITGNSGFPKSHNIWTQGIQPSIEKQLREQGIEGEIKWKIK